MNFSPEDYMRRPRNSKREHELARELRQLPEEVRFSVIEEFIQFNLLMGLKLAYVCLQNPKYFRQMLDMALDTADASSIQHWLDCVVPKLGFRRVMYVLSKKIKAQPTQVDHALYFMGKFLSSEDSVALRYLEDLRQTARIVRSDH